MIETFKNIYTDGHIHRVVYINLDHRTDRRAEIESECRQLRVPAEKLIRFAAIAHVHGIVGCGQSHLAVLRRARDEGWPNVMILEDDFLAALDSDGEPRLQRFFREVAEYDVLLLACNLLSAAPHGTGGVDRTLEAQTTSGYVVHERFYDALIANFEQGLAQLTQAPHQHGQFGLDMYWKLLQPSAQWFHAAPAMGTQRASFSDIEQRHVDYGV